MKLLSGVKQRRQISALERLEKQLTTGTKNANHVLPSGTQTTIIVPLSDKDIKRIKQEIQTLKSRI